MRTSSAIPVIQPRWPAPRHVRALVTTRLGGVSKPPYDSLNLALHVGDDVAAVEENRLRLIASVSLDSAPCWLEQVHGVNVLRLPAQGEHTADASITRMPGQVCAVMTADCLPVLLTDKRGSEVAAVHAGWRGLAAGVIEQTLAEFAAPTDELLAWLGPAISQQAFEVGDEVREAFLQDNPRADNAFKLGASGKWHADLYALARQHLQRAGIAQVWGGDFCTYTDVQRFYSYRRDGVTGRMASLIWLDK